MKKITLLIVGFFFMHQLSAQFKLGGGLNYIEKPSSIGIQAKALFGINEHLAMAGDAGYYITKGSQYDLNANLLWRALDVNGVFKLYPEGGIGFYQVKDEELDIGINLGLFSYFPVTDTLDLYIEPKVMIGSANSFALAAGVFFL